MLWAEAARLLVPQGHALGPARAAAGVQDERDIVGLRRRDAVTIAGVAVASGRIGDADEASFVHLHCVDWDFASGGLAGFFGAIRRAEQNSRGRVVEIEAELFLAVSGVERRGGAGDGSGQKTRRWRAGRSAARWRLCARARCLRPPARRPWSAPARAGSRRSRGFRTPGESPRYRGLAQPLGARGAYLRWTRGLLPGPPLRCESHRGLPARKRGSEYDRREAVAGLPSVSPLYTRQQGVQAPAHQGKRLTRPGRRTRLSGEGAAQDGNSHLCSLDANC